MHSKPLYVAVLALATATAAVGPHQVEMSWLWINPDIESRDLIWGLGSAERTPKDTEYQFIKEDTDGKNPKYVVKDSKGVTWKVKIGLEPKPEIAASRLIWAVGYHANEDYFVPSLRVLNLPENHRGKKLTGPDGTMKDARLRRDREQEKKVGFWNWDDSPFQ